MAMTRPESRRQGFTLVEVLLVVGITSVLVAGLADVSSRALAARAEHQARFELSREAAFAMERIVASVSTSERLLIPLAEDPATGNLESVIDPGFLAVTLSPIVDLDLDGFADADNDQDGRVDEDLPADSTNDSAVGVWQLDDDNSGISDISFAGTADDDETGLWGGADEDPIDGIDNDGDGTIDEDPGGDMNNDGEPGVAGVDDDGDGSVDEGDWQDDDEDGSIDEDWYDVVAYRMVGTDLVERWPDFGGADGRAFTERVIAANVAGFRVERLPLGDRRDLLLDLRLELARDGHSIVLETRVRVGGRL